MNDQISKRARDLQKKKMEPGCLLAAAFLIIFWFAAISFVIHLTTPPEKELTSESK